MEKRETINDNKITNSPIPKISPEKRYSEKNRLDNPPKINKEIIHCNLSETFL